MCSSEIKTYSRKLYLKTWRRRHQKTQPLILVVSTKIKNNVFTCWQLFKVFHYFLLAHAHNGLSPNLLQVLLFIHNVWSQKTWTLSATNFSTRPMPYNACPTVRTCATRWFFLNTLVYFWVNNSRRFDRLSSSIRKKNILLRHVGST